jgi:hypothetical protein
MQRKIAYLNDAAIGEASTWTEVYGLLKERGVHFIGKPGAAEGPTGFYVQAAIVRPIVRDTEIGKVG